MRNIWVKPMSKPHYYFVAKCTIEKPCPKCQSIGASIVVNRGPHYTLYCSKCGAYIKHANDEDKQHTYVTKEYVEDETPLKVWQLCIDSQKTMTTKK